MYMTQVCLYRLVCSLQYAVWVHTIHDIPEFFYPQRNGGHGVRLSDFHKNILHQQVPLPESMI